MVNDGYLEHVGSKQTSRLREMTWLVHLLQIVGFTAHEVSKAF